MHKSDPHIDIQTSIFYNKEHNKAMVSKHHYSKILISKQELATVYKLLKKATEDKLRLHLPKCSAVDPYRVEVENILNRHLAEILADAKYALIVDGIDLEEADVSIQSILTLEPYVQVEPFDPSLDTKLRNVLQEVEDRTIQVTRLRRELPLQARDAYEQLVYTADQELKATFKDEETLADPLCPPLDGEISTNFQKTISNLSHIHDNLPVLENKIKLYNQVYDFLVDVYNRQNHAG